MFIYPGIYKYDKLDQRMPVKINRLTGNTQVLVGTTWESVTDSEDEKADQVQLLKAELNKSRESLKAEVVDEISSTIKAEVLKGLLSDIENLTVSIDQSNSEMQQELEKTRESIAVYKKFETDPDNYFAKGSSKDQVKAIMGVPTSTLEFYGGDSIWYYSTSEVEFKGNKVDSWRNLSENLRVK